MGTVTWTGSGDGFSMDDLNNWIDDMSVVRTPSLDDDAMFFAGGGAISQGTLNAASLTGDGGIIGGTFNCPLYYALDQFESGIYGGIFNDRVYVSDSGSGWGAVGDGVFNKGIFFGSTLLHGPIVKVTIINGTTSDLINVNA